MGELFDLLARKELRPRLASSTHYCSRSPNYLTMNGGVSDVVGLAVVRQLLVERRWLTALQALAILLRRGAEVAA